MLEKCNRCSQNKGRGKPDGNLPSQKRIVALHQHHPHSFEGAVGTASGSSFFPGLEKKHQCGTRERHASDGRGTLWVGEGFYGAGAA